MVFVGVDCYVRIICLIGWEFVVIEFLNYCFIFGEKGCFEMIFRYFVSYQGNFQYFFNFEFNFNLESFLINLGYYLLGVHFICVLFIDYFIKGFSFMCFRGFLNFFGWVLFALIKKFILWIIEVEIHLGQVLNYFLFILVNCLGFNYFSIHLLVVIVLFVCCFALLARLS